MKLPTKKQFFGFVDKSNTIQGIDPGSGSYPYDAHRIGEIKFWELEEEEHAKRYIHTINYGDKGYKLVKILISVEDALA